MAYEPMSFAVGFTAEYGGIQNTLFQVQKKLDKTMEKLSTGQRINDMKDDEGGKAIADTMSSWKSGTDESIYNLKEFITMTKIAEKALNDIQDILFEMKQTVDRLNGIEDATDRSSAQAQLRELAMAINKIVEHTEYKGFKLFNIAGVGGDDYRYLAHTMKNDEKVLSHSDRFIRYGAGAEDYISWDLGMDPRAQQLGMVVGTKISIDLQDVYQTTAGEAGAGVAKLNAGEVLSKMYLNGKKLGEIAQENGIDLETKEGMITAIKLALGENVKVDIVEKDVADEQAIYTDSDGNWVAGIIGANSEGLQIAVYETGGNIKKGLVIQVAYDTGGNLLGKLYTDTAGTLHLNDGTADYKVITDDTGQKLYVDKNSDGIVDSGDILIGDQNLAILNNTDGTYGGSGSSGNIAVELKNKKVVNTKKTLEIYIQTPGDFVYGEELTDSNGNVIGVQQQVITSTLMATYEREFKGSITEPRGEDTFATISVTNEVKTTTNGEAYVTKKTVFNGTDDQTIGEDVVYTGVVGNRQRAIYFANVDNEGNDIKDQSSTVGSINKIGQVVANEGLFDVSVMTNENAALARVQIEAAISQINELRGVLAAMQHQAESLINQRMEESVAADEQISHITDTDYAKELAKFTRQQIAQQAGINMLAQKRQMAQLITQLLR